MRPLLFLTFSQARNSIRRSVTSARRLFAIIVIFAYWYFYMFRFVGGQTEGPRANVPLLNFPPVDTIVAITFAGFLALTLLLWASSGIERTGFRPADVDVLFPTPIDPRLVMVFRMVRQNFQILVVPLIFLLIGRGRIERLFHSMPKSVGQASVMKWAILAYVLLQVLWIAASYAVGFWASQDDKPTWARRIMFTTWLLAILAVAGQVAVLVRNPSEGAFIGAALHGPLRWVFPTATAATIVGTAPFTGQFTLAYATIAAFLGATGLLVWAATRNAAWMYESAALAASASGPSAVAMRSGDMLAAASVKARQGKLKARRLHILEGVKWRGAMAVVWREAIISARTSLAWYILWLCLSLFYSLMPLLVERNEGKSALQIAGATMLIAVGVTWLAVWMFSRTGFIDLLRRVDADKALPFPMFRFLLAQSTVRNVVACSTGWLVILVSVCVQPSAFGLGLAAAIVLLPYAYVVSSIVLVFLLLFPDIDDSSQRLIRDLMTMAAMMVSVVPSVIFGGTILLLAHEAYIAAAVVSALMNAVVAGLALLVASEMYASYNPSE